MLSLEETFREFSIVVSENVLEGSMVAVDEDVGVDEGDEGDEGDEEDEKFIISQ